MKRTTLILAAILVGLHLSGAVLAYGGQLFSTSGIQGSGLHVIDEATGSQMRIMDLPIGAVTGLSGNGQPGNTFVWSVSSFTSRLAKIQPASKTIVSVVSLSASVRAIAINPTNLDFIGVSGSNLVKIDPITGVVTTIAVLSPAVSVESLAFDMAGQLYGIGNDSFFTINAQDAALTVINNAVPMNGSSGLAVRPSDGTMLMVSHDGGYKLFTIDPSTGSRTFLGNTLSRPNGLAFAEVPEPTILTLLIGAASSCFARRIRTHLT